MNLRMPDAETETVFRETVRVRDIFGNEPEFSHSIDRLAVQASKWPIGEESLLSREEIQLLEPLLAQVDYFDFASVKIKHGGFADEEETLYESEVLIDGLPWPGVSVPGYLAC